MSGNYKLWSTEMNTEGFMGFVDKWWIFWNRVGVIIALVGLTLSIVTSLLTILQGKKEIEKEKEEKEGYTRNKFKRLRRFRR